MSFDIQLYKNSSPTNKVTKDIGSPMDTLQGTLRAGASIIDPSVIVQLSGDQEWRTMCNYAYIPAFGRYYYITNIISLSGQIDLGGQYTNPYGLWELHMHVDVLMSYAEGIKQQTAVVARQEEKYNLYLDDGTFMCYQNPKIQTKLFSVTDPFETQEFVLMVAGN